MENSRGRYIGQVIDPSYRGPFLEETDRFSISYTMCLRCGEREHEYRTMKYGPAKHMTTNGPSHECRMDKDLHMFFPNSVRHLYHMYNRIRNDQPVYIEGHGAI